MWYDAVFDSIYNRLLVIHFDDQNDFFHFARIICYAQVPIYNDLFGCFFREGSQEEGESQEGQESAGKEGGQEVMCPLNFMNISVISRTAWFYTSNTVLYLHCCVETLL